MIDKIKNLLISFANKNKEIIKRIVPASLINFASVLIQKKAFSWNYSGKYDSSKFENGVNLFGFLSSNSGVGQGSRIIAEALHKSDIPFTLIDLKTEYSNEKNYPDFFEKYLSDTPKYGINIVHVNPRDFFIHLSSFPKSIWQNHYNICIWLWELEDYPDVWDDYFLFPDEIWTPSVFNSKAIEKKSKVPVYTIPYGISVDYDEKFDRNYFGIPQDKFVFFVAYDFNSGAMRKNPRGAVDAYKRAFNKSENTILLLKIGNAKKEEIDKLKNSLSDRKDIIFFDKSLSKIEFNSLLRSCDVFVSLHRSEGFGLVPAESMYLGIPSIATAYSANLDFMNSENSCLIDYELIPVEDNVIYLPLFEGKLVPKWADPNIEQASEYMIKLYRDRDFYNKISENAQKSIRQNFSIENTVNKILMRKMVIEISESYKREKKAGKTDEVVLLKTGNTFSVNKSNVKIK